LKSGIEGKATRVMNEHREPQYEAYAAIVGTFFAGLGVVSLLARRSLPATALDLVALSAATFKASRTLSRERVGSFVREPFVEGDEERPAGEGLQRALGELVTCSRCVGTWVAAGLASTQMVAPRFGRAVTWTLGAAAANDFLQAGFSALCAKANELEDAR
jgi:Protein of unknown function (DUF1360)